MRLYSVDTWLEYGEAYWLERFMAKWEVYGFSDSEYQSAYNAVVGNSGEIGGYLDSALARACEKFKIESLVGYAYLDVLRKFIPIAVEFRSPVSYTSSTDSHLADRYVLPSVGDMGLHVSGYIGDGYRHLMGAGSYDIDTPIFTVGERNAVGNGSGFASGLANLAIGRGYSYVSGSSNSVGADHVYAFGREISVGVYQVAFAAISTGHAVASCSGCGFESNSRVSYSVNGNFPAYTGTVFVSAINGDVSDRYYVAHLHKSGNNWIIDVTYDGDIHNANMLIPSVGASVCIGSGAQWASGAMGVKYDMRDLLHVDGSMMIIGGKSRGYTVTDRNVVIGNPVGSRVGFGIGRMTVGNPGYAVYEQDERGIVGKILDSTRVEVDYARGNAYVGIMGGYAIGSIGRGYHGINARSSDISIGSFSALADSVMLSAGNLTVGGTMSISSDRFIGDFGTVNIGSYNASGYAVSGFAASGKVNGLIIDSIADMTIADAGRTVGFLADGRTGMPWLDFWSDKPGFYEYPDKTVELRGNGFSLKIEDDLDISLTGNGQTTALYDIEDLNGYRQHVLDLKVMGEYSGDFCTHLMHTSLQMAQDVHNHSATVYDKHGVRLNYWTLHNMPLIQSGEWNSSISVGKLQFRKVGNIVMYEIELDITDYSTALTETVFNVGSETGRAEGNSWYKRTPVIWFRSSEHTDGVGQMSHQTMKALCPAGMEARGTGTKINRVMPPIKWSDPANRQFLTAANPIVKFHPMQQWDRNTAEEPFGFRLSQGEIPEKSFFLIRFGDTRNDMHGLMGDSSDMRHHRANGETGGWEAKSHLASQYGGDANGHYDVYTEGMGGLPVGKYSFSGMYISENVLPL